jgi:hypothetical protein
VHLSVYLFNSAHPEPMVASPSVFSDADRRIATPMLVSLLLALGASMLLYVAFVRNRYRLELEREELLNRIRAGGAV